MTTGHFPGVTLTDENRVTIQRLHPLRYHPNSQLHRHPIHGNWLFPNFRIQSEAGTCPKGDSLPLTGPQPVSDICVSDGQTDSWTDWPAGWLTHHLAYCLPEKTELVQGAEEPLLYPILQPSSDEPLPLAQEACPQAHTSLTPLSTTGLPHLAQDPCIWCHKHPGSISASSDTASHSGIQGVHIQGTSQGVWKDRLQVYLLLMGKNKGGRRSWHWVMITILQKEPGEESKPNPRSWPQRNEGAIRIPVSRQAWDSDKLSPAQPGGSQWERRYRWWGAARSSKRENLWSLPISLVSIFPLFLISSYQCDTNYLTEVFKISQSAVACLYKSALGSAEQSSWSGIPGPGLAGREAEREWQQEAPLTWD